MTKKWRNFRKAAFSFTGWIRLNKLFSEGLWHCIYTLHRLLIMLNSWIVLNFLMVYYRGIWGWTSHRLPQDTPTNLTCRVRFIPRNKSVVFVANSTARTCRKLPWNKLERSRQLLCRGIFREVRVMKFVPYHSCVFSTRFSQYISPSKPPCDPYNHTVEF